MSHARENWKCGGIKLKKKKKTDCSQQNPLKTCSDSPHGLTSAVKEHSLEKDD